MWGLLVLSESQLPTDLEQVSLTLLNLSNRLHYLRSDPLRDRRLAVYPTWVHGNLLLPANIRADSTKRQHFCPPKKAILEAG